MRLWAMAMLLWLAAGCATTRVVNLDTGRGRPIAYAPVETEPVRIDEEAFKDAVTRLVLELKLDVAVREDGQRSLLASMGGIVAGAQGRQVLRLSEDFSLDPMERRRMALSFALDTVWEGVADAVQDLMDPAALRAMVTTMIGTAMVMLVAPEPVTKLVAVVLTASLIAYLGTGPVWNLGQGFLRLMDESRDARDVAALKEAGHRFGRVLGSNGARVLVIVAMTALGGRNAMAAQGPRMPGFPQAALRAEAGAGFQLSRALAGEVRSISVSSAGVLNVTLAPTAVAAVAMGPGGGIQGDPEGDVHHICTDKNEVSEQSGGPWTPVFEPFFEQAGMSLNDPANLVRINGHRGPHPAEYHKEVRVRLNQAMRSCRGVAQCRAALVDVLAAIAKELTTAGTRLRKLITRNPDA
ncbi:AHH domain-containing protein [Corallococcus exercitus]|uniref:AHH domain-containing protein n=1 Tax=Corallococcus exercitus TaxID=2316736 RepID=A0A7Y4JYW7_9BACT|nr:AHH domain-containing protein [Corallococcus exercitus]NOK12757.1 AHH domain-containing protein [Corallococcus exercitus]